MKSTSPDTPLYRRVAARIERVGNVLGQIPLPLAFVVLALPIGIFLVFAQPPGQGLDENAHFYRVWTLAHGAILAPQQHGKYGGLVPQCVIDYFGHFSTKASQRGAFSVSQFWHSPGSCSAKQFTPFPGSAVYSPVAYIPSLIAVVPLVALHAPLPVIFFAGRLVSLLVFIGLFYAALRIAPIGKEVLFVLGLLPTSLLLASTYSADPMTTALAALCVALTLRCYRTVGEDRSAFVFLFVSLLALALAKPTYVVLAFFLFLVPAAVLGRIKHSLLLKTAATGVVLIVAALWYSAVRSVQAGNFPLYGLKPHAQMRFIVDHPFGYVAVLARTFFESSGEARWLPGFFFSIGYYRPFSADNIYAPVGLVVLGSLTLWYAYGLQFDARRIVNRGSWLVIWLPIALTIVGVLLVETALFIYGTPSGLPEVNVQGRYLFPLVPIPLVTIGALREPRLARYATTWVLLGSSLMVLWLVLKIFVHDYAL